MYTHIMSSFYPACIQDVYTTTVSIFYFLTHRCPRFIHIIFKLPAPRINEKKKKTCDFFIIIFEFIV